MDWFGDSYKSNCRATQRRDSANWQCEACPHWLHLFPRLTTSWPVSLARGSARYNATSVLYNRLSLDLGNRERAPSFAQQDNTLAWLPSGPSEVSEGRHGERD
jgi:hypothetical protein